MTDLEIRISSLKGIPPATLSRLDSIFDGVFGKEATVYSDSDWFVMGLLEGALVSRVGILRRVVSAGEEMPVVGGISGVATLPDYRRRGYATALMKSAREFMRDELPTDFGLLICSTALRPFYERLGWRVVPGPTTYAQPGGAEALTGLTMVLELSRAPWPSGPIDLCGYPW